MTVLQIRRGNRDNLAKFSAFLHTNICCDPSSELSCQNSSNERSLHMFSLRNKENFDRIILKIHLIWSLCVIVITIVYEGKNSIYKLVLYITDANSDFETGIPL